MPSCLLLLGAFFLVQTQVKWLEGILAAFILTLAAFSGEYRRAKRLSRDVCICMWRRLARSKARLTRCKAPAAACWVGGEGRLAALAAPDAAADVCAVQWVGPLIAGSVG